MVRINISIKFIVAMVMVLLVVLGIIASLTGVVNDIGGEFTGTADEGSDALDCVFGGQGDATDCTSIDEPGEEEGDGS